MNDLPEVIQDLHLEACLRKEYGYIDPESGKYVMTEYYLKERGHCCHSGCRHCPYPKTGKNDDQFVFSRLVSSPQLQCEVQHEPWAGKTPSTPNRTTFTKTRSKGIAFGHVLYEVGSQTGDDPTKLQKEKHY